MTNKRNIILYIATSLDGHIASEDGTLAWLESTDTAGGDTGYTAVLERIDTVLMGKGTYEIIRGFDIPYPYQDFKNYVFSSSKTGTDEYATFTNADVVTFVRDLQSQPGKDIWLVGGGVLAREFFKHNLIDEFQLAIAPQVLGQGISLYVGDDITQRYTLERVQQVGQMAMLYYRKQ
ncbi:MAG: dihydrofolate reductase family protein [Bacilli bacterium]